jgi:hypothetical protein
MSISTISPTTLFSGDNITTSTYTYNSGGWLRRRGDKTLLQIHVATLNATSISYRLEGRATSNSRSASVLSDVIIGVTSIDKLIEANDYPMHEYRLGVKIDKTASPNNIYASLITIDHN